MPSITILLFLTVSNSFKLFDPVSYTHRDVYKRQVWMLTGIWHGAGWNFLFWGLWFAFFLILEKLFLGDILESVPKVFGRVYTLAVVLISWVFFALESPGEILAYLQAM